MRRCPRSGDETLVVLRHSALIRESPHSRSRWPGPAPGRGSLSQFQQRATRRRYSAEAGTQAPIVTIYTPQPRAAAAPAADRANAVQCRCGRLGSRLSRLATSLVIEQNDEWLGRPALPIARLARLAPQGARRAADHTDELHHVLGLDCIRAASASGESFARRRRAASRPRPGGAAPRSSATARSFCRQVCSCSRRREPKTRALLGSCASAFRRGGTQTGLVDFAWPSNQLFEPFGLLSTSFSF
jgi:hypothetical protein